MAARGPIPCNRDSAKDTPRPTDAFGNGIQQALAQRVGPLPVPRAMGRKLTSQISAKRPVAKPTKRGRILLLMDLRCVGISPYAPTPPAG